MKPKEVASGSLSTNSSESDLATALAYGAIASLPATQRARAEAAFQGRNLTAFREAVLAWTRGSGMTPETFADRFFGRSAADPVVQALRDATKLAMTSTTPADRAVTSGMVADAMQCVGLDRWSRFIADAQARARDPATEAAIKASIKAPDAITPIYPEKYLLGARGVSGLLRAGVGALAQQTMQKSRSPGESSEANSAESPGSTGNQEAGTTPNSGAQAGSPGSVLPANPGDLLAQGWRETTHPKAAEQGHRTLESPTTGESLRFDRGRPGERGFEGQDHYHRFNPNSTGNRDLYLDVDGNPAPRGGATDPIFFRGVHPSE